MYMGNTYQENKSKRLHGLGEKKLIDTELNLIILSLMLNFNSYGSNILLFFSFRQFDCVIYKTVLHK